MFFITYSAFVFPVGLSSLSRHFQQVLLRFEVFFSLLAWAVDSWSSTVELQLSTTQARRHPTRLVENVVITTNGPQEKKSITIEWDGGEKVNKNLLTLMVKIVIYSS